MREQGMYWDELRQLIFRNRASNSDIRFYRDKTINPLNIAVFDRTIPKRKPDRYVDTGNAAHDQWRDSHVCEAAFFNGEIPIESSRGSNWGSKFEIKPYHGVIDVLGSLISEGSLRRTDELREIFVRHGRPGLPRATT